MSKKKLTENEKQLVGDLLSEFSNRVRAGQETTVADYKEKMPNDRVWKAFQRTDNLTRFAFTMQKHSHLP